MRTTDGKNMSDMLDVMPSLMLACDRSRGGRTGSLIVAPGLGKLIFAVRV
jgi:hypothetical protein